MPEMSRRKILRTGAAISTGIASGAVFTPGNAEACPCKGKNGMWEKEYTFGHTIPFHG